MAAGDTLATLSPSEPTTNGYSRVSVSSTGQFQVTTAMTGHNVATSPIVTFRAVGGTWGPVRNLFCTTSGDNSGSLIASVALTSQVYVANGEQLSARIGLGLKDCP